MTIPTLRRGIVPTEYTKGDSGTFVPIWVAPDEVHLAKGAAALSASAWHISAVLATGGYSVDLSKTESGVSGSIEMLVHGTHSARARTRQALMYASPRIVYETRERARIMIEQREALPHGVRFLDGQLRHVIISPRGGAVAAPDSW